MSLAQLASLNNGFASRKVKHRCQLRSARELTPNNFLLLLESSERASEPEVTAPFSLVQCSSIQFQKIEAESSLAKKGGGLSLQSPPPLS